MSSPQGSLQTEADDRTVSCSHPNLVPISIHVAPAHSMPPKTRTTAAEYVFSHIESVWGSVGPLAWETESDNSSRVEEKLGEKGQQASVRMARYEMPPLALSRLCFP